jgi:hypothetical protein
MEFSQGLQRLPTGHEANLIPWRKCEGKGPSFLGDALEKLAVASYKIRPAHGLGCGFWKGVRVVLCTPPGVGQHLGHDKRHIYNNQTPLHTASQRLL